MFLYREWCHRQKVFTYTASSSISISSTVSAVHGETRQDFARFSNIAEILKYIEEVLKSIAQRKVTKLKSYKSSELIAKISAFVQSLGCSNMSKRREREKVLLITTC